jgi:hypothetical protein
VTNNRWHILDPLPFRYRLSFYMELYPHELNRNMAYGRIGYHYARPGLMDDHVAITPEDVRRQELPTNWTPAARGGARNSRFYEPESQVRPGSAAESVEGNLWTAGRLYIWKPQSAGEQLALAVPVEETGRYTLQLGFAMDSISGQVALLVDGKECGFGGETGVVDLYDPHRTLLRCFGTHPMALEAGEHIVTLVYKGTQAPGGNASVGIDFIWVRKE